MVKGSNDPPLDCVQYCPWSWFGSFVLSLPFLGLLFCVIYSIVYDFRETTSTHCNVYNFLPSISAAAGAKEPQMSVWRWCIVIHTFPRYYICLCYMIFYSQFSYLKSGVKNMIPIAVLLNFVEVTALCLLTLVSSSSNHEMHAVFFAVFVICSVVYMILSNWIFSAVLRTQSTAYTQMLKKSLMYKKIFAYLNWFFLATVLYMYHRHNKYCEPGVYSLFALAEYLLVFTNIAYHGTAIKDFNYHKLVYSKENKGSLFYSV